MPRLWKNYKNVTIKLLLYFWSPRSKCNDTHKMQKISKIQGMFKLEVA